MEQHPNIYSLLIAYAKGELDADNRTHITALIQSDPEYREILDDIQHLMCEFGSNWHEVLDHNAQQVQDATQSALRTQASEIVMNDDEFAQVELEVRRKIKESKIAVMEMEIARLVESLCQLKGDNEITLNGNERFIIWQKNKHFTHLTAPENFAPPQSDPLKLIIITHYYPCTPDQTAPSSLFTNEPHINGMP